MEKVHSGKTKQLHLKQLYYVVSFSAHFLSNFLNLSQSIIVYLAKITVLCERVKQTGWYYTLMITPLMKTSTGAALLTMLLWCQL